MSDKMRGKLNFEFLEQFLEIATETHRMLRDVYVNERVSRGPLI